MRHIRNVPWQLGDVAPDFVLGRTTCAMFLRLINYYNMWSLSHKFKSGAVQHFICHDFWVICLGMTRMIYSRD